MRKIVAILIISFCSSAFCWAQDYSFSNHNIVPFSLNPAMAGNANAFRLGLNYRRQWPDLGNHYHTVRASYDQNIFKQMSSIGVAYSYDNMGGGIYQTNEFGLVYSHAFRLQEEVFVRLGLQVALFANYLNWNNLTFEDQYDPRTGQIIGGSIESFEANSRMFPDFSAGGCFVIENKFSIGVSVCHIAEPNNGFDKLENNTLSRKFVAHANYTFDMERDRGLFSRQGFLSEKYFFANTSYQQQSDFKLAQVGAGVALSPIIVGGSLKNDLGEVFTISGMLGFNYQGLQLYYIHDVYTASQKKGLWSFEIALIYIWEPEEKPYTCPVVYW